MKYYLHDTNAFSDEKITMLFIKYGYEGLGLFYTALEKLAAQEKPINTDVLKTQLKIGKHLGKIFKYCENLGLLSSNNGQTFSEKLLDYAQKYQIKNEKNRKKVLEWRENQRDIKNVTGYVPVCNHGKVNKSKVNKEGNKNNIQDEPDKPAPRYKFVSPTKQEIEDYCIEAKITIDVEQFLDHYIANGWVQSNRKQIVDWRAAIRNWKRREKDFSSNKIREDDVWLSNEKSNEIVNAINSLTDEQWNNFKAGIILKTNINAIYIVKQNKYLRYNIIESCDRLKKHAVELFKLKEIYHKFDPANYGTK